MSARWRMSARAARWPAIAAAMAPSAFIGWAGSGTAVASAVSAAILVPALALLAPLRVSRRRFASSLLRRPWLRLPCRGLVNRARHRFGRVGSRVLYGGVASPTEPARLYAAGGRQPATSGTERERGGLDAGAQALAWIGRDQ